jgi:hypothetical protein
MSSEDLDRVLKGVEEIAEEAGSLHNYAPVQPGFVLSQRHVA